MDIIKKSIPVSCFSKEHRLGEIFAQTSLRNVCQSISDPEALEKLARESRDDLRQIMEKVTAAVDGAELVRLRVKDRDAIHSKIENQTRTKRPEEIKDYLGGRIAVDSKAAMARVIHGIYQNAHVISTHNRLHTPSNGGYRALHIQVMGTRGLSAEIQILPREVNEAKQEADILYQRWRRKPITDENRAIFEADKKHENDIFEKAWKNWEARTANEVPFAPAPQSAHDAKPPRRIKIAALLK